MADDDGIRVVPHAEAEAVLAKARRRVRDEEAKRTRYAAAELGLDVNAMRDGLRERGLPSAFAGRRPLATR